MSPTEAGSHPIAASRRYTVPFSLEGATFAPDGSGFTEGAHHPGMVPSSTRSISLGLSPLSGETTTPSALGRFISPSNMDSCSTPARSMLGAMKGPGSRPVLSERRIGNILKNFKFFQDMSESVLERLPAIVSHVRYPEGTILFRQGDPPGNCYAILSGEVGIFVKAEEEEHACDSARAHSPQKRKSLYVQAHAPSPTHSVSSTAPPASPTGAHSTVTSPAAGRGSMFGKLSFHEPPSSPSGSPIDPGQRPRAGSLGTLDLSKEESSILAVRKTVEGFSTYHDGSEIGKRCAVFGSGKLFGELALMQSGPRSATIKCLKDSEFLVICRREFDQVLKDELAQANERKMQFLCEHVPGMKELPLPKPGCNRPHASYFFKKVSFCKDHEFLTQGASQDEALYVVYRGSVDLHRYECPVNPHTSSHTVSTRRQNKSLRSAVLTAPKSSSADDDEDSPAKEAGTLARRIGVMLKGSVFGPLPFAEPEPFTVNASSQCEAYCVSVQDFVKLPRTLIQSIQEHLAATVTLRLARLRSDRCIRLKDDPSSKKDVSNLPHYAKNFGLKLMKVGKIHPHPVLLRTERVTKESPTKRPSSRGSLGVSESLPSMPTQASVMSNSSSRSGLSRAAMKLPQRPSTSGAIMQSSTRPHDHRT